MKMIMYAIVFTTEGLAIQVPVAKGKSVNPRFYEKKVLRKLVKFFLKHRPKMGIQDMYLLHDNA